MRWRKSPPSPQLGLLPPRPPLGETLKREGIETVLAHNPDWHALALLLIRDLPPNAHFTAEDLFSYLNPPNKNAAGAVISTAARLGLIVRTTEWRKAADARKHAHLNPVWRRAA